MDNVRDSIVHWHHIMRFQLSSLYPLVYLAIALGTSLHSVAGLTAERIVLKYGTLKGSIAVADLTTFAETGKTSLDLEAYLHMSKSDPQAVRQALTKQTKADPILLDRALNSPLGETALDKIGEAIHPPSGVANRQALRSALVLSASDDGKLSLLEAIQKYPTQEVQVEVDRLITAYQQISELEAKIRKIREIINLF
jgi:hypothetical protein